MAKRRAQREFRCQINYLPDRHAAEKMAQVYRRLAPPPSRDATDAELTLAHHEKNRRHLR
jgi:spore germination cell wall hydrolase CwlJ-like protein